MNIKHTKSAPQFKGNDEYYAEIASNIWLMDNHKWAYYIWELNRELFCGEKVAIVHVDFHWDAVDDFYDFPDDEEAFKSLSIEKIKDMVYEEEFIRFDSFICPAIIRGISDEIHFLCFQTKGTGEGIYDGRLKKSNTKQFIYRTSSELSQARIKEPYIFDFCIDTFNWSEQFDEGDIWDLREINTFLNDLKQLVVNAQLITISMSYGYSGTEQDTERLTKYVLEKFLKWRGCSGD